MTAEDRRLVGRGTCGIEAAEPTGRPDEIMQGILLNETALKFLLRYSIAHILPCITWHGSTGVILIEKIVAEIDTGDRAPFSSFYGTKSASTNSSLRRMTRLGAFLRIWHQL